ncbi:MAG: AAA family ATPase, partial [Oscillospiraceae bacterium]|nr:AAA family ATPase [Oscillospiraceae bacterium]
MKIALYGISRCGKDYLIQHISRKIGNLLHLKGSETLNQLAQAKFGVKFNRLDKADKEQLRVRFTEIAEIEEQKSENVIVDAHYSFPADSDSYEVVMTDADKNLYDVFIYMNSPTERIVENQKIRDDTKSIKQYTVSEIEKWKAFEIENLNKICIELGKELIILDGDIAPSTDFITELISYPQKFIATEIAKNIVANCKNISDTVILTDCDKTLSYNDTTIDFCKYSKIDMNVIRNVYKGEYYSLYQFYKANSIYDTISNKYYSACKFAAKNTQINTELIKDIKSNNVSAIGLTSGIADIWDIKRVEMSFPDLIFGKSRTLNTDYYISYFVKLTVVKEFHKIGKKVIAIGDSPIDIGMLEEADKGYIITSTKLSSGIERYIETHSNTKIKQLSYNPIKYNN